MEPNDWKYWSTQWKLVELIDLISEVIKQSATKTFAFQTIDCLFTRPYWIIKLMSWHNAIYFVYFIETNASVCFNIFLPFNWIIWFSSSGLNKWSNAFSKSWNVYSSKPWKKIKTNQNPKFCFLYKYRMHSSDALAALVLIEQRSLNAMSDNGSVKCVSVPVPAKIIKRE